MNSDVEDLFDAARRLKDPTQRQAFLDAACCEAPQLRQELEQLLALEPDAQALLDPGAASFHPKARELRQMPAALLAYVPVKEQVGDLVGRYKLREKIGEGGCGVVYVADQQEPVRRRVALKVIKVGMDTKNVIARFDIERQALAIMDHPNIAKVLDAGATDAGRPYFVMEMVRGVKITEFCDQNRLSTEHRLELFVQVCGAVQHAHQKGIIHRDLKPSNILVTLKDGVAVPKIIDFGIAKAIAGRLSELTIYTELHQLIGTPAYMSPEQACMTSLDIDTRCDIYSLGVVLYELLTGRPPFEPKELVTLGLEEMRRTIREKEPLRPSTRLATLSAPELNTAAKARGIEPPRLRSRLRGDLDWIVLKCLEKDRARRYDTASGLAADIRRHLGNEPVVARPPSQLYQFQKFVRRNKLAFVAAVGVTVSLIAGLTFSTWSLREEAARQRAVAAQREQMHLRILGDAAGFEMAELLVALHNRFIDEGKVADAANIQQELQQWMQRFSHEHLLGFVIRHSHISLAGNDDELSQVLAIEGEIWPDRPWRWEANARRLAEILTSEGKYRAAEQIFKKVSAAMLANSPRSADALGDRAEFFARRGRWQEAANDAASVIKLNATNHLNYHALVALRVATGEVGEYRELCQNILLKFGQSKDPFTAECIAKDCLILPVPGTNLRVVDELVADAVTARMPYGKLSKGLAEYRQGHFASAIEWTQKALADAPVVSDLDAEACFVLAMAQYELNQVKGARVSLSRGVEIVETKLPKLERGDIGPGWIEWVVAHALMREAQVLLQGAAEASTLLRNRAEDFARGQHWREAAADFSELFEEDPENYEVSHSLALLLVELGDLEPYRRHCALAVQRFSMRHDPVVLERIAEDCLILPSSGVNLEVVGQLAETAVAAGSPPFFWLAKALAEYRRGHFDAAVESTQRALEEGGDNYLDAEACMVLAMARHQLSQKDKARASLAEGEEIMEATMPKVGSGHLGAGWTHWIIADALRREARSLIEGSEPKL